MKEFLAIDIALLPPDEVMDTVIAINKSHKPDFLLNKTSRLPHITLCQATIKNRDIPKLALLLEEIASRHNPLILKAKLVNTPYRYFKIDRTKDIDNLHDQVMASSKNLILYDIKPEYFYDSPVRESSVEYVRNFQKKAAYEKYDPHISLGIVKPTSHEQAISFVTKRLTICHLGNYNTCRKILFETVLKER
ncbi:MAG: hypothetical protein ABSD10_02545 [Candidatus Saccharimonadales bacterium]|jgi:hypothetical protein